MIKYLVTRKKLEELIEAEKPGWLKRAADRTEQFRASGSFDEASSIWSEVKPVYMRLQGQGKCAFCEREMESVKFGKAEQDVEHFRPKGRLTAWKVPKKLKNAGIPFAAISAGTKGYHLLPYHPFNYSVACKPCNSALKKDQFPIAGTYDLSADDPANLVQERAYLIYPIGPLDTDPETLIEFRGTSPKPVTKAGHDRNRALVTIEFFKLDDPDRANLYRDRALIILGLFPLLQETTRGTAIQKAKAQATVNDFLTPRLRHLNCARSFRRLFDSEPDEAKKIYDAAINLLITKS
ncbi:MAG: hypothetical protein JSS49_04555 [Planctomycetes bacterium]|nr:hypothetical protein [Planctomycetota bacterium]